MTKMRTITTHAWLNGATALWLGAAWMGFFADTSVLLDAIATGTLLAGCLLLAAAIIGTLALGIRALIVGE